MIRKAVVAGHFYPGTPSAVRSAVSGFLKKTAREKGIAVIVPHAGYIYSGSVAGSVYSSVTIPDTLVLIGPNHTGRGKVASIMDEGSWEMPLGAMEINQELSRLILKANPRFSSDRAAHALEHSLEVQLPFIYSINKGSTIVPLTVMQTGLEECTDMGLAIAKAIKAYGEEVLMVVSSDMNHYESDAKTREKDRLAIDMIKALDAKGLLDVTLREDITMCGVIPAVISIIAAKELGATSAELIKYSTSGEANGDFRQVVGYAGMVIK